MNAQSEQVQAGLYAREKCLPIPLQRVRVSAEVRGFSSRVTLTQIYRNDEGCPIEAVYIFPLPEAADLCGFTLQVGGRTGEGRVLEREEAFPAYGGSVGAAGGGDGTRATLRLKMFRELG